MGSASGQGSSRQVKAKDCEVWSMGAIDGSYLTVSNGSEDWCLRQHCSEEDRLMECVYRVL